MLNLIEAFQLNMPSVTFTREDESGTKEVECPLSTYVRNEVRNWWAHQMPMDAQMFKKQMDAITSLVKVMDAGSGGDEWVKVTEMASQWDHDAGEASVLY